MPQREHPATITIFANRLVRALPFVRKYFWQTIKFLNANAVILFASFVLIWTIATLFMTQSSYERTFDAQYHQTMAETGLRWDRFSLDLGANPLTHFGILPVNPMLSPTYWLGYGIDYYHYGTAVQTSFQAVVLLLLLVAVCRAGGANTLQALAIALIGTAYCWVPFLSNIWITADAMLGRFWQDSAIAALLTFFCFSRIGLYDGWLRVTLLSMGLMLIAVWHLLALPYTTFFYIISSSALCLGAFFAVQTKREAFAKLVTSLSLAGMLFAIGAYGYLINLFNYTAPIYYTTVRPHDFRGLFYSQTSMLIASHEPRVYFFFTLVAIGAIVALRFGSRYARYVVFAALTLELTVHLLGLLNLRFKVLQLAFTYIEQMGIPVVALLAGVGLFTSVRIGLRLTGWIAGRVRRRLALTEDCGPQRPEPFMMSDAVCDRLGAFGLVGLALAITYRLACFPDIYPGWGPPKTNNEPARIQLRTLKIEPGSIFRGRSIALLEMGRRERIAWGFYFVPILFQYKLILGYDMMNDAEAIGVPEANEYGHWASPPMVALLAAGFYRPIDVIGRGVLVPRAFRPNLARLMGVALVVSDQAIPGETKLYQNTVGGHPLFIYKVAGTNVGQYSPSRVVLATKADQILDRLQAPDFNGRDVAIVEEPVHAQLVPAEEVTVHLDKGPVIHVSAYSPGTSLLVLPFDYSHCLYTSGAGLKRIIPVNLSQTGLLVHGDASIEIRYRYGLFAGTSCRKRDLERIRELDLENAATGRLFYDARQ